MSLCIVWQIDGEVHLASDSCASLSTRQMPYGGIKIMEIPVKVRSAIDSQTGEAAEILSTVFGMAFAGSFFTAHIIKELLADVFTHLQWPWDPRDITFGALCELAFKFYRHFHHQIASSLPTDYELDFFLAGSISHSGRVEVAKFHVDPVSLLPAYAVLALADGDFATIGAPHAQERFEDLLRLNLQAQQCRMNFVVLRRLCDIMRDARHPTVAGAVQSGRFENGTFKLLGTVALEEREGGLQVRYFVRGAEIEAIHEPETYNEFFIQYSYEHPFGEDIREWSSESYWEGSTRRALDELITVVPYEPRWVDNYEEAVSNLEVVLGDSLIKAAHIGSTAIPGAASRPVIDVLIAVADLPGLFRTPLNLSGLRYEFLGDRDRLGRGTYRKRRAGEVAIDLYFCQAESDVWREHLAFRDELRRNPSLTDWYSKEKVRLLNSGSWTFMRYRERMAVRISQILSTIHSRLG